MVRHPRAQIAHSTAALPGDQLLAAAQTGDLLHIYSATSVQQISLRRAPADGLHVRVSSWGARAAVLLVSRARSAKCNVLLIVDCLRQRVLRTVKLHRLLGGISTQVQFLAQGAHSVAVSLNHGHASMLATTGRHMGRERFPLPASFKGDRTPQWDPSGRFMAAYSAAGVCVLAGRTLARLALWLAPAPISEGLRLRWLCDSSGLVLRQLNEVSGSWSVLRLANARQLDM